MNLVAVVRGAFVLRRGWETEPAQGRFEGWVEEVDSGRKLRFGTPEELLIFLGKRQEMGFGPARERA